MEAIRLVHILGGSVALVAGYPALFARKGKTLHRTAGLIFLLAMLVMGVGASTLAVSRGKQATALGAPLVIYLVITAWTTVRAPRHYASQIERVMMLLGIAVGLTFLGLGIRSLAMHRSVEAGVPIAAIFLNASVALLGGIGDVRVLRNGPLHGGQRIYRHLWRMCFAFFMASGSFFLGQADKIPASVRYTPALILLALTPLLAIGYWSFRLRSGRRERTVNALTMRTVVTTTVCLLMICTAAGAQTTRSEAETAYKLGRAAIAQDDYEEATRRLERAVALQDTNADYHYWLGRAVYEAAPFASKLKMVGMARRVKQEWERAYALNAEHIDSRASLAEFYAMAPGFMGGSEQKAQAHAAALAKRDPLRGALARAVIAQHKRKRASELAAYEEAITLAPDSLLAYVELANAYAREEQGDNAFATLERFARGHPEDRWLLYQTGRIAGVTGKRLEQGELLLSRFIEAPPADATTGFIARAYFWLGRIAEKRKLPIRASEQYRIALSKNPNSIVIKRALAALNNR
jgi:tetratricopeptide (TPR) repeat protein